jgi:hypothetical protein
MSKMFIRTNSAPESDLARGYSYSMGEFGNEDEAHAGLSGYSLDSGVEDAIERLDARMGVSGRFGSATMFVTVFEGSPCGPGPDGEDLFAPSAIVASFDTTSIKDAADLAEKLAALGIAD